MDESQPGSKETVRVLAALSDDNRYRIVELLAHEDQELTCGAIGKALGISPSLLSHHLAILAEAGIVGRRKNGLWTMNALERPVLARQVRVLEGLIGNGHRSGNGGTNGAAHAGGEAVGVEGLDDECAGETISSPRQDGVAAGS